MQQVTIQNTGVVVSQQELVDRVTEKLETIANREKVRCARCKYTAKADFEADFIKTSGYCLGCEKVMSDCFNENVAEAYENEFSDYAYA